MKSHRSIRQYESELKRISRENDAVYRDAINRWENREKKLKTKS
jgi:hypothetical protein